MAHTIAIGLAASRQVRAAMLGAPSADIDVVRQAWRVSDTDSDELAVLRVGSDSWWMARRLSDELSVWAYANQDRAEQGFERVLREGRAAGANWRESRPDVE